MKNLLLILLAAFIFQSCNVKTGSGNIERQTRNVSSFHAVNAGGGFEVFIKQGSSPKLTISGDDNILDDIMTDVSNGKLRIRYRNNVNVNNADIKIYIETPQLDEVVASASSDIKIEGTISSDRTMLLHASSSGSVTAAVDAPAVELDASSSGTLHIKGRTRDLDTRASSGSSIDARELLSENAKADASSGASISLHASLKLDAEASSGASIDYRGEPAVSKKESSGGSIGKAD